MVIRMGLFTKLRQWRRNAGKKEHEEQPDDWNEIVYAREEMDIHDKDQREAYVRSCLDQIADATRELENLKYEYGMVTSYLRDMEEIEALPPEEKSQLTDSAGKINTLESRRAQFLERKNRMSQEDYHRMDRLSGVAEEGLGKLKEAEDYRELIKQDLKRLDGEHHAYQFRKGEVRRVIADTKGMAVIILVSLALCMLLLFVLQFAMGMETRIGYLLTAGLAAVALTVIYLRHSSSVRELRRVEKGINRIILLQNRVKIRYVNNTNLLEYLCLRYETNGYKELKSLWDNYQVEKEEREKLAEAEEELDENQQELLAILRRYQIKDPLIWLHQTDALLNPKEMVEIRHNLIIRRQSLRKRMDYNDQVIAHKAQEEIKDLVDRYPQYAQEILGTVDQYERSFA